MMTEKEIEDSLAVCESATAAPWRTGSKVGRTLYVGDVLIGVLDKSCDAAFAARARTDLPKALLALRQARREYNEIRQALDKAIEMIDAARAKP